jgi:M6 family metalloprotease-like protein
MKIQKLFTVLTACLISLCAYAVPAKPGAFSYTQPDGSVVKLERHGDEFFSWTTLAGTSQVVALDEKGFWKPSSIDPAVREEARQLRAAANRQYLSVSPRSGSDNPLTYGNRHIPVLLVAFSDVGFSLSSPEQKFDALLNEKGYSANGGTGSVHDFFAENSHDRFTPVFDVYGPVTLENEMAYYGKHTRYANDEKPEIALYDACVALDGEVDFSQYDYDNDGEVDMILFYYAGYSEAEGGPTDAIWPHRWTMQASSNYSARNARFDGVKIGSYFCTAELRGTFGATMCGIGTTCHEFSHALGLPDFYDTDYSANGYAGGLYVFSTMDSGCYNNDSNTPPYFNAEERILLGWMDKKDLKTLPAGTTLITGIKDNVAYQSPTETDGEYFVYEYRDGTGWDTPLPEGLVIYHVDKSKSRSVGGLSPYQQWNLWTSYNSINAYGSHPCFYVIPAADQTSLYYRGATSAMVFPGSRNVTTYSPIDWEKNETGLDLTGISLSRGQGVSVTASYSTSRTIIGSVKGQDGTAIPGVRVVLGSSATAAPIGSPSFAPRMRPLTQENSYEAVTGNDGTFSIDLEGYDAASCRLTFSKEGYQTAGLDVQLEKRITEVQVTLLKVGEEPASEYTYSYFDQDAEDLYVSGITDGGNTQMAAIRIPAASLPQNGGSVTTVYFIPYYKADAYYVIVDAGNERILTYKVPNLGNTVTTNWVQVSLPENSFPGGKDLYVGYAVENARQLDYASSPFLAVPGGGQCFFSPFSKTQSSWQWQNTDLDLLFAATVRSKSSQGGEEEITSFAQMGINAIADPGNGTYAAGYAFPLNVQLAQGSNPQTISWSLDGKSQSGSSVTLTSGRHTITAVLTFADGSVETLELTVDVK